MVGIWPGCTYENAPEITLDFCLYSGATTEWTGLFRDLSTLNTKCEEYSGEHFHLVVSDIEQMLVREKLNIIVNPDEPLLYEILCKRPLDSIVSKKAIEKHLPNIQNGSKPFDARHWADVSERKIKYHRKPRWTVALRDFMQKTARLNHEEKSDWETSAKYAKWLKTLWYQGFEKVNHFPDIDNCSMSVIPRLWESKSFFRHG